MNDHSLRLTGEAATRALQASEQLRKQFPVGTAVADISKTKQNNSGSTSQESTVELPPNDLLGGNVKDEEEQHNVASDDERAELAKRLRAMGPVEASEVIKLAFSESGAADFGMELSVLRRLLAPADAWTKEKEDLTRRAQASDAAGGDTPLPRSMDKTGSSQSGAHIPVKIVPKPPSEMDEETFIQFCKQVQNYLAPDIKGFDSEKRKKAEIKIVESFSYLNRKHFDEIFNFIINKGLSADNLDCLGVKARAAVLKVYYVGIVSWEEARTPRPTAKEFLTWLKKNLPDRCELRLLQGDLKNIDSAAYQKIITWTKTPPNEDGEVVSLSVFGLPTKKGLYDPEKAKQDAPTGGQVLAAQRAGDLYAPVITRRYDRLRKNIPPNTSLG